MDKISNFGIVWSVPHNREKIFIPWTQNLSDLSKQIPVFQSLTGNEVVSTSGVEMGVLEER